MYEYKEILLSNSRVFEITKGVTLAIRFNMLCLNSLIASLKKVEEQIGKETKTNLQKNYYL